jgi:hypothetical protein
MAREIDDKRQGANRENRNEEPSVALCHTILLL